MFGQMHELSRRFVRLDEFDGFLVVLPSCQDAEDGLFELQVCRMGLVCKLPFGLLEVLLRVLQFLVELGEVRSRLLDELKDLLEVSARLDKVFFGQASSLGIQEPR